MKVSVDDSSSLDKEAEVNNMLSRSCNKNPSLTTVAVSQVDEQVNIRDFNTFLWSLEYDWYSYCPRF